ncbi:F-box domain-containing protein [Purpureocillium lavendulum]|uniref:F-box domain-containing protein n=1 Tax=Purpureocillium lavendulum TaxID=1247861 RepID=A0AB34FSE6_9HYPO|nr:F-box domain-containing protein [Purpureocillium lavendulum]
MNSTSTNLGSLPDHLFLDIVEHLDTARDVSSLGASCHATQATVLHDGWKAFARRRFPSLRVPTSSSVDWRAAVDRMAYLDRCWEQRGFRFSYFREGRGQRGGRQNQRTRHGGQQSVAFQTVVDACLISSSSSLQEELLACGTGEDLRVRWRSTPNDKSKDIWRTLPGKEAGYSPGTGDVTALSAIERDAQPEVIVGRANGDVQLLSAAFDDSFGKATRTLLPVDEAKVNLGRSPGQRAVTWTEWRSDSRLLASCRSSLLTLYDVSSADASGSELEPMAYYDVSEGPDDRGYISIVHCAKFMGRDTIACGISGSSEPLRWGKIRPSGLELTSPKYLHLDDGLSDASLSKAKRTVWAIEPLGGLRNEDLLLIDMRAQEQANMHGARLLDMRTPSRHDAIYRDPFQPYNSSNSLLVYGSERFIGAAATESAVRIFDFRYPKPYFHSDALPCSEHLPTPRPWKSGDSWSEASVNGAPTTLPRRCDYGKGTVCAWHATSRNTTWRPDATLFFSQDVHERAGSLAKSSDLAESFYIGARGAFIEADLTLAGDSKSHEPKVRKAPDGWKVEAGGLARQSLAMAETGVSLYHGEGWQGVDPMATVRLYRWSDVPLEPKTGSRLDVRWKSQTPSGEQNCVTLPRR